MVPSSTSRFALASEQKTLLYLQKTFFSLGTLMMKLPPGVAQKSHGLRHSTQHIPFIPPHSSHQCIPTLMSQVIHQSRRNNRYVLYPLYLPIVIVHLSPVLPPPSNTWHCSCIKRKVSLSTPTHSLPKNFILVTTSSLPLSSQRFHFAPASKGGPHLVPPSYSFPKYSNSVPSPPLHPLSPVFHLIYQSQGRSSSMVSPLLSSNTSSLSSC